jgi:uncharacterized protein GlcG (DUF336 family)
MRATKLFYGPCRFSQKTGQMQLLLFVRLLLTQLEQIRPVEFPKFAYARHPSPQIQKEQRVMKTKAVLEQADIKAIAAAAEAEALKNNWAVTIAIVDDGGHLLHLQRLEGAAPISAHIAPAKANTAAMGQRESKVYEDVINGGRTSFLSAPYIQGMLEGGVPIVKDGQCLGAVGVSGVKSNEDAQVARAGIAAIGL